MYGFAEVGIKGGEIFWNILKFHVHACLSNGHSNLWSNFNYKKLLKSETWSCVFARVGFKGGQIAWNVAKVGCMIVYLMGIQIYDQVSILRSWSKGKLHRAVLLGFGLKESKITMNILKVGVHSYLPNAHLNLWSNFNSEKLLKSETLSCGFTKIGVKVGENSSKRRESWSARLSIKWASKSMIEFQFWEIGQKWNSIMHFC